MSIKPTIVLRRITLRPYREGAGPVFKLVTWDAELTRYGKHVLGYRLSLHAPGERGRVIFRGEDFGCSPMHAIDSRETIAGILGFLTIRPGDTDAEYFEGYTRRQREFCSQHAESLAAEAEYRFGGR